MIPAAFAGASALIAVIFISSRQRYLVAAGIKPAGITEFRHIETVRWTIVTVVTLALVSIVGLLLSWRPGRHSVAKSTLLGVLIYLSIGAAYWPERQSISAGWIVHPPPLAILLPPAAGLVSIAIYAFLLRKARGEHVAAA